MNDGSNASPPLPEIEGKWTADETTNVGDLLARTIDVLSEGPYAIEVAATAKRWRLDLFTFWAFIAVVSVKQTYHVLPERFQGVTDGRMALLNDAFRVANRFDRQSGHFFLSYRRADGGDLARAIFDALATMCSASAVFFDVHSMPLGSDYRAEVRSRMAASGVAIVVMGDRWADADHAARLAEPLDAVRLEIEAALDLEVPILIAARARADLPTAADIPESLRSLLGADGLFVEDFGSGADFLDAFCVRCANLTEGRGLGTLNMPDLDRDTAICVRPLAEIGVLLDDLMEDLIAGAAPDPLLQANVESLLAADHLIVAANQMWGRLQESDDEGGLPDDYDLVGLWAGVFAGVFDLHAVALAREARTLGMKPAQLAAAAAMGMVRRDMLFMRRSAPARRYWPETLDQMGRLAAVHTHGPIVARIGLSAPPPRLSPFSPAMRLRNLLSQNLDELLLANTAVPAGAVEDPESFQNCGVYLAIIDDFLTPDPVHLERLQAELAVCRETGAMVVPIGLPGLSVERLPRTELLSDLLRHAIYELRDDPLFVADVDDLAAWCRLWIAPQVVLSAAPTVSHVSTFAAPALRVLAGVTLAARKQFLEHFASDPRGERQQEALEMRQLIRAMISNWARYLNLRKDNLEETDESFS